MGYFEIFVLSCNKIAMEGGMENEYLRIIRNLREDHDYSQEYIASKLGISQRTYSHYESGDRKISLETAIELAKLLEVDMNELCGFKTRH